MFFLKKNKKDLFSFKNKKDYINIEYVSKYYYNRLKHEQNSYNIITDDIAEDVDFNDVFKKIDRTISKIGQQYFYYKLRIIKSNINELKKFSSLVTLMRENKEIQNYCITKLSVLNSDNNYLFEDLFNNKIHYNTNILIVSIIINIISVSIIISAFFNVGFIILLIPLYFINVILHYRNKPLINYYLTSISEFSKAIKVAKKLSSIIEIKNHFTDFEFLNKLSKIKKKISFINFENYLKDNILSIIWLIIELIKMLFNIEVIVFFSLTRNINKYNNEMNKLFTFIGEIDASISVATLYNCKYNICNPIFNNKKSISFKNIYHPLIDNCVTNSLTLNNKSLLLTGSNMSGKTTFIRTIALNSIFAQTINITFADYYNAPFFKLITSIRSQDNINTNTSYYLDEVLSIKKIINTTNEDAPHLFILDEIFKGTNTLERIAIGKSILSYINNNNNIIFVSTHDIELAEFLYKNNYELYHFSENIIKEKLIFDHKIKKGKLVNSNAIKILDLHNYPKEIIINAEKFVKKNISP